MKQTNLLIAFLLFSFSSFAQTSFFSTNPSNKFYSIAAVNSGGGYITYGIDSVNKQEFVRWDDAFNPTWKIKITDTNIGFVVTTFVEASDGNFYICTHSKINIGSIAVIKVSATGTILWQKNYLAPGANSIFAYSFNRAAGLDNGFIFGTGNCTLSNCLVKCDGNGDIVWQKTFSYSPANGVRTCVSIEPDGNNYSVCTVASANTFVTSKISSTGTVLSFKAYKNITNNMNCQKMVKLNNNQGYIALGNYNGAANSKYFLAFYDTSMTLKLTKDFIIGTGDMYPQDIVATPEGNAVLVSGILINSSSSPVVYHSFVMKIANNGIVNWDKQNIINPNVTYYYQSFEGVTFKNRNIVLGGYGNTYGSLISMLDSNGNGLCNESAMNSTSGGVSLTLQTGNSFTPITSTVSTSVANYSYVNTLYVNKHVYCGSIPNGIENNELESVFELFPNPSNDKLIIKESALTSIKNNIEIVSLDGKIIYQTEFKTQVEISTSSFLAGVYLVRLRQNENIQTSKLVIQH